MEASGATASTGAMEASDAAGAMASTEPVEASGAAGAAGAAMGSTAIPVSTAGDGATDSATITANTEQPINSASSSMAAGAEEESEEGVAFVSLIKVTVYKTCKIVFIDAVVSIMDVIQGIISFHSGYPHNICQCNFE